MYAYMKAKQTKNRIQISFWGGGGGAGQKISKPANDSRFNILPTGHFN